MTKYINLTVDVEAQPLRATDSHLDRLIWGRWGSEDWGIGRMMDIADQYGVKLSFYVDYCEYYLYGDHLLDVAKEIVRRGHDAQVHLHPEFLPADLPGSLSVNWNRSLNSFDQAAAPSFAAHFTSMAERAAGRPPLAYRGGAFRFSPALDQAFAREGLRLSSNYFSRAKYWSAPKPHAKFFSWPSGMFELPLSTVHVHGRHRHLIFEDYPVHDVASLAAFAEAFDRLPGEIGILNLLLHSWSFLRRDMEGRYVGPDEQKIDRFHKLLDGIAQLHMRAVTTSECIEIAEAAPPPSHPVSCGVFIDKG